MESEDKSSFLLISLRRECNNWGSLVDKGIEDSLSLVFSLSGSIIRL